MKTKNEFEKYLNEMYGDYSLEKAIDLFAYWTNEKRFRSTTNKNIRDKHKKRELGSLFRKIDPLAFNIAFNEIKNK